jgi:hypothetical protein
MSYADSNISFEKDDEHASYALMANKWVYDKERKLTSIYWLFIFKGKQVGALFITGKQSCILNYKKVE